MRVTAAFKQLLALPNVHVREVRFEADQVVVFVVLRRRRLVCPLCSFSTRGRRDMRTADSSWRHLDLGRFRLEIRARLRRLRCPTHGVRTEGVPFARPASGFTRDFEDLVAWLATEMNKTAVCRLVRIAWRTVGDICTRVVADSLDPRRLDDLFEIGIDEVSWRKQHRYLTLVTNHQSGKIVWGTEGKDTKAADRFFQELGTPRSKRIRAVSIDMAPAYRRSIETWEHAPYAKIVYDPFHVVQLATNALDQVRSAAFNELRRVDQHAARKFRGARWSLMKNPDKLNDQQSTQLRQIRRRGGDVWRAYTLKEALRAVFDRSLPVEDAIELLDRFCAKAQRSRLKPFVTVAQTVRAHRFGIVNGLRLRLSNARAEALNNKVRLIIRRAYGFHSAKAALALVLLSCGPTNLRLPHEHARR